MALLLPPDQLVDRYNAAMTCLLTASALLFVIGADMPKLGFLTKADWVVTITFFFICIIGVESFAVSKVSHKFS
jgi:hypothetical protein